MYAETEAEGKRRRHQMDTVGFVQTSSIKLTVWQVVEGIGVNRITKNFSQVASQIDDAIKCVPNTTLCDANTTIQSNRRRSSSDV